MKSTEYHPVADHDNGCCEAAPTRRSYSSSKSPIKWKLVAAASTALLLHAYIYPIGMKLGGLVRLGKGTGGRWTDPATENDDWDAIPTSKSLQFQDCYPGYQCARLELPLDWFNGTHPDKHISLAVVRYPAQVPITDPRHGGAILFNPGGPGGSGVEFVKNLGPQLQTILDSPKSPSSFGHDAGKNASDAKYFDMIGFDPRGIFQTRPGASCWTSNSVRQAWMIRLSSQGLLDSSDAALGRIWSMNQALGASCEAAAGDDDIKKYITTSYVARDILALVEKYGEWRETQARRLTSCPKKLEALRYRPGEEKLQYWGLSYGTYLGSTFASMFPDRVGRLILDGVVHADNYAKTLWSDNLLDTQKALDAFYAWCAHVGKQECSLASSDGITPEAIQEKVKKIIWSLYHNPLPIKASTPEILTFSDIRSLLFISLYFPRAVFPLLPSILEAVSHRDIAEVPYLLNLSYQCSPSSASGGGGKDCKNADTPPPGSEAQPAILCADGDPQDYLNTTTYQEYLDLLHDQSPTVGAAWGLIRLVCTGWKIRALNRFTGPFKGNTSHPILWIGNTADPVTPLKGARTMAKTFPGSVVLTQNSVGHCSISSFSKCTIAAVRAYFHNGTLPERDTVCEIDDGITPAGIYVSNVDKYEEEEGTSASAAAAAALAGAHETAANTFMAMNWGLGASMLGMMTQVDTVRLFSGVGVGVGIGGDDNRDMDTLRW